ncbi:MAG: metal ABC transporter ATP-binding protein, partial [Planctomycetaceae bacterium]
RLSVGYVTQRESLDWDCPVTVRDEVLMGTYGRLGWFRSVRAAERQLADQCLADVGMLPYRNRQISNLSGGERQRVFLARALAQQSRVYFMDEPFVGVDAATESAIMGLLRKLKERGCTVVVVHHDLQTAPVYFDRILLLNMRLVASGPTSSVFTPELLQQTYGGRLTILSEAADRVAVIRR